MLSTPAPSPAADPLSRLLSARLPPALCNSWLDLMRRSSAHCGPADIADMSVEEAKRRNQERFRLRADFAAVDVFKVRAPPARARSPDC